MYSSNILFFTLLILGFMICFPALWLTWKALAPGWVDRSQEAAARRPVLSLVLGLAIGSLWFIGSVALMTAGGPGGFVGGLCFALFWAYAMAGLAGFATHLGTRLPSPADTDRPWKATLRGGIALELTWVLPLLGWVVILPLSLAMGVGCATVAIFGSIARASAASEPFRADALHVTPKTEEPAPAAALHA